MSRRHHYRKSSEQVELDITTFLNLMVVLIPFLLVTAVFSKITIQELNAPAQAAGGPTPDKPVVTIEVMVRKGAIQIGDGSRITTTIPKKDGEYNLDELSHDLYRLKQRHPKKEDVTVLLEPNIEYKSMIAVMDAVTGMRLASSSTRGEPTDKTDGQTDGPTDGQTVVLFPEISIGDAP
jgi:biopolymer transport protein ExbD